MNTKEYEKWVIDFYRNRGWYEYDPFVRINYLTEEVGEVSDSVKDLENTLDKNPENNGEISNKKDKLLNELGDVLDNIIILADKYDMTLEDVIDKHISVLKKDQKEDDKED
ncbi:MazG-like family protein [Floricoccus penangensis]|uniref:MazG-like family protein n=1 Tax=Floricoccus penangensis TaxID=1859475 RepID=UPI00203A7276|nr:MazG-like family protein [Floricoccus penangensis]URZ86642.1 MazG-like family protein [Floricoccus penangensis]